jgi:chaperonin GroES
MSLNYDNQDQTTEEVGQPDTDDQNAQMDAKFFNKNIAEGMSEDELLAVSNFAQEGFRNDLKSREEWESDIEEWVQLAKQCREAKTYPWPNASNVKYPLLSTASMQFAARAYPSLIPSNGQVVNCVVVGKDKDGQKLEKANRVSTYMSYQVMYEMKGWNESMDKMLLQLPIVGTMFKKTWYDKGCDKIRSELIQPKNFIVNNWANSLYDVERTSEIIEMSQRVIKEKQNLGIFLDIDLGEPTAPLDDTDGRGNNYGDIDSTTPYQIIEQHTFYDFDDDGYAEPCIISFERQSGKVLRISNRYYKDNITMKPNGKGIAKIEPIQMYTKFGFIPNPDGSFYDVGFGQLLGPLNEAVNSLINMQIDSGQVNNLQSGFIAKSLRMKMGDARMTPGEWRPVNATSDDLRKSIVPLPAKEPSAVLFQLMGSIITSAKELASVAEIFTGKMPGQNTPATTTMATIEQGMKVFTAVYKRIYRAMEEEFDKIFDLNHMYMDPQTEVRVLDEPIGPDDFDRDSCDIEPGADPTAISQTEKLIKAQGLMELMQAAPQILDPVQVISRILDAQEQPNWQQLFTQQVQQTGQTPPPPPDPKMLAIQAKMQADQNKAQIDQQMSQNQMELNTRDKQQQMMMRAQEHQQTMQFKQQQAVQDAAIKTAGDRIKLAAAAQQVQHQAVQNQQQLHQNQQVHEQKIQQAKETSKLQNNKSTARKK